MECGEHHAFLEEGDWIQNCRMSGAGLEDATEGTETQQSSFEPSGGVWLTKVSNSSHHKLLLQLKL